MVMEVLAVMVMGHGDSSSSKSTAGNTVVEKMVITVK